MAIAEAVPDWGKSASIFRTYPGKPRDGQALRGRVGPVGGVFVGDEVANAGARLVSALAA